MNEQAREFFDLQKERARRYLENRYEFIIRIYDGFAAGHYTIEEWNPDDMPGRPILRSKEDLVLQQRHYTAGAADVIKALNLLSHAEVQAIDGRYRAARPEIFWPYEARTPPMPDIVASAVDYRGD